MFLNEQIIFMKKESFVSFLSILEQFCLKNRILRGIKISVFTDILSNLAKPSLLI